MTDLFTTLFYHQLTKRHKKYIFNLLHTFFFGSFGKTRRDSVGSGTRLDDDPPSPFKSPPLTERETEREEKIKCSNYTMIIILT